MSTLLAPHLVHLRAAGHSPRTIEARETVITVADRKLPYGVDNPSPDELAAYLANPDWSTWTRITYYRHLNGLYDWASAGHYPRLEWNPITEIKCPKPPRGHPDPVTDDELAYATERSDAKWKAIIALAAYAGVRANEISVLRREDVTAATITIRHGKGDRCDVLPTHPEIWRRIEPMPPGLLFPNRYGRARRLSSLARQHFDRIHMRDVHLHRFRHWFATMLLDQGATISTVQSLMRHESLRTTALYLLVRDEQRRFAVGTLPVPRSTPLQEAA